jgi:colanic acid/amylovoran biosynthesis glycosyltransferase
MRNAGVLRGPIVTSFYGYDANVLPRIQGPRLYKKLFSCGDKFLVGSEFLRNRILSLGAPKHRITKLQMGADLSQFRFAARVKGREFRLLTVARLVEVKGVEYAIRSLALLKVKCPHVRYVIAGDGPLRRRLELLVDELGLANQVDFVGAVSQEEALPLFEAAHAFVLPSVVTDSGEEEGQPIVLAEAQASGLPVIATAIGGIPESIRNKESGFLVPPGDPEALASAILWLAYHPEKWGRMGRAGRAHVEKSYDLENLNDRLIDIYHAVSNAKLFRDE